MTRRATGTHPFKTDAHRHAVTTAAIVVLFVIILLFLMFVPLREARGWVEVFTEGAAFAEPLAADAVAAISFTAMSAVAVAWLYWRQLAN